MLTALLTLACAPAHLRAQEDSATVVAGPTYGAGPLKRVLLGAKYRDLWLTPIRVPVLRPDTFAGGLTVLQRGGSPQTASLRFRAADGREYVFRSVDKDQHTGLPEDLRNTLIADVIQDRVSAKHPGAALVAALLLRAAGVLHAPPTLAVMGDHPLLGEHRGEFAGMLGTIEERPNESEEGDNFGGFDLIIGSERLLERLRESPRDRADSRAYLAARLMDFLVGDWDRHPDQWRWAQAERGGTRYWLPIPRDRDNAFSHMDGLLGRATGMIRQTVMEYEREYENLYGLIHNAQPLDRRILADLPLTVWDSVAHELQRRVTDRTIAEAVAALPAGWAAIEARPLARKLRARRDALPEVARTVYTMMAAEVDVYATDAGDMAELERLPSGAVRARLLEAESGAPYFDRLFLPQETREIRVHLRGGADRAIVRGPRAGLGIRILGGPGDDLLEDASGAGSGLTAFYDHEGENRLVAGPRTRLDRRSHEPPVPGVLVEGNAPPPRDWGRQRSTFSLRADWRSDVGPVIGGGPSWTRYGFRRRPYAEHAQIAVLLAPLHGRMGVEAEARRLRTGGGGESRVAASASRLEATRFHGFGNETPAGPSHLYRIWSTRFTLSADLVQELGRGAHLAVGPRMELTRPETREADPASLEGVSGARPFGATGLRAELALDRRDSDTYPRRGLQLLADARAYPLAWGDATEPFGGGLVSLSIYLPLPGPLAPTLAMRGSAERVVGRTPLQHAAFLGESGTLRGYPRERFAGDAAVHGGVELRTAFGRANLRIARGELGGIAFADAGRVFVAGERSERWHRAYGMGLWYGAFDRAIVAHLLYAVGEHGRLHAGLGMPF